jgi:signal transduction histidine kinase
MLITIINDILDYSKAESGKFTFEEKVFILKVLIRSLYELHMPKCLSKGIKFNLFDNIDAVPEFLKGYKVRMSQITTNIIGNAIKFTEVGNVSSSMEIINKTTDHCSIKFSVIDTGIGIPKNKLNVIFKRFEQAESDTNVKYGGTGLGLSISKNLVELQGGIMEVDSEVNKGSKFSFTMPFKLPSHNEIENFINLNNHNKSSKPDLNSIKILLAEDTEINRKLILKVLDGTNCTVVCAENGKICIKKLKNKK